MRGNPAQYFHKTWLGMVQPTEGLVVSIPALMEADCFEKRAVEDHREFLEHLEDTASLQSRPPSRRPGVSVLPGASARPPASTKRIRDLRAFLTEHLGWSAPTFVEKLPEDLRYDSADGHQTVVPTFGVKIPKHQRSTPPRSSFQTLSPAAREGRVYRLLVWELPDGLDLDKPETTTGEWEYAPAKKFERLLREARVPIGLLINGRAFRLIYAPAGETTGHIDFPVNAMAEVSGRPIYDAFLMLLSETRLQGAAPDRQLHAILEHSRKMQAEVTTALAEQVKQALEILLAGFEAADKRAHGQLLQQVLQDDPDRIYQGLLTVLLRLVVILYAEDNALLPVEDPLFGEHYSLFALYARLEQDRGAHPDTMNQRFGAWPALLALFRAIHRGTSHGNLLLPKREGELFDTARFAFLEGNEGVGVPTVDDETVYQLLRSLTVLNGDRLSYRALQVEQIGSVYEALMGFHILRAEDPSVRVRPSDSGCESVWLTARELLKVNPAKRAKWLKETVGLKGKRAKDLLAAIREVEAPKVKARDSRPPAVSEPVAEGQLARTLAAPPESARASAKVLTRPLPASADSLVTELLAAERVRGTEVAKPGQLLTQPGAERRRTSSHYTPKSLSEPIVARTLEPLLLAFGPQPTSEQILSLTVCDPAMGSGAFLVEACRYLGDRLYEAWTREERIAEITEQHEDPTVHARRLVAEKCLYGVDKNPLAVELAKISLWLLTFQREKPFSFLDHTLRCGDSLVGCSFEQITAFHWKPKQQLAFLDRELERALQSAVDARSEIAELSKQSSIEARARMGWLSNHAQQQLSRLRTIGDLLIGAFFSATNEKAREVERLRRLDLVAQWLDGDEAAGQQVRRLAARTGQSLIPFHWHLEYPEVFFAGRVDPLTNEPSEEPACLDGVVGNPPFMGGSGISGALGKAYLDWLLMIHPGAHGNGDLSAHFFRRMDALLGAHGTIGLIATNTIAQGDTRATGLQTLVLNGATIYDASESVPWPGEAVVMISVLHLAKGQPREHVGARRLDGVVAPVINSRLRPKPERADPVRLAANRSLAFVGAKIYGQGFILTPAERDHLIKRNPANSQRIFPYIGGQEVNTSPTQDFERYVINFGSMSLEDAIEWPDLIAIVRERVKPQRDARDHNAIARREKRLWWRYRSDVPETRRAIAPLERCLVNSQVSKYLVFARQPTDRIFAHTLYAYALTQDTAFAILQSRIHERWARLLSSSMKTDLRYAASDCFETFPFPRPDPRVEVTILEDIGTRLYETRRQLMEDTNQGLTKTYNALKDPIVNDPRIEELRQLHIEMDQAVLAAYAEHTGDQAWLDIEVPAYTDPQTPAERSLHQTFEDQILDHLFALNELRANR